MKIFRQLFYFYIKGSIHVAFSCLTLLLITQQQLFFLKSSYLNGFVFFSTLLAYNFVKYESLVRVKKVNFRNELKVILVFSGLAFLGTIYYFFQLQWSTQVGAFFIVILTLLYALPFFPNRSNARNWKGIKIYIVSLCWALTTVVLPALEGGFSLDSMVLIYGLQRFIMVFVLIIIFEIVDLKNDDPLLRTVPQLIGVQRTKHVGFGLLVLICLLDFLIGNFRLFSLFFILITALFLAFAHENSAKYYTLFWVESIPIFLFLAQLSIATIRI
jgi:hypothetical protein